MTSSLVGSEMCIRDRLQAQGHHTSRNAEMNTEVELERRMTALQAQAQPVSYTHLTLPTICSV
eukprot:6775612-Prorocentrum_lima.AAC.1